MKIIQISKKDAHALNKQFGVPFGEGGISISGTKRKYYLCENYKNMALLKKIKNN